jgi:hypothetical protein
VEYLRTIKVALICGLAITVVTLSGCANRQWLTDSKIGAEKRTPEEIIELLGPPAKIDQDQRVPLHKGKAQEYRYFVVDRSGEVQFRRYFYDGPRWLTASLPYSISDESRVFRVIDPRENAYQQELSELFKARPDLRP